MIAILTASKGTGAPLNAVRRPECARADGLIALDKMRVIQLLNDTERHMEAAMAENKFVSAIAPEKVHSTIGKLMLADGMDIVMDLENSRGAYLRDSKSGKDYLDFFTCFASSPIGFNHPRLTEPEFITKLGRAAVNKPSNSDLYTTEMAEFVETFGRIAVPAEMKHLFFISGGGLAVENALKTAFDWKVRKNIAAGVNSADAPDSELKGMKAIHFKQAFHGRTGYTLTLTNTFDPRKTQFFPKFEWPRVNNPMASYPLEGENLAATEKREAEALAQIEKAFADNPNDIACMVIEPIQGEGGDNHFRPEFMQALSKLAKKNDALLVFDEVQTGLGLTGTMWCYQQLGMTPDIVCFGKKTQICGIMATDRIDEVKDNVFVVSSRINSTWGGNLIDMVRCQRYLEVIEEDGLVANAETMGRRFRKGLEAIAAASGGKITNVRGRGLMCAFDLPTTEIRDDLLGKMRGRLLMALPAGPIAVRFRPPLNVTADEIDTALAAIEASAKEI